MINSLFNPEAPMFIERDNPAELYQDVLQRLLHLGHRVDPVKTLSSPSAGKGTIELLGTTTVHHTIRQRLIWTKSRPLNVGFAVGQAMYVLAARDDVESADYYNRLTSKFSDNGETLHGAYGPRIRSQISDCIWMLKNDPGTRRAVITIFDGHLDHKESKDIPCPVSMQFLVRRNRVICITQFRSQNWVMLYPYDIFLFTWLHEWIAVHAGYVAGNHIQVTASNHIYENEKTLAQDVLRLPVIAVSMPPMDALEQEQRLTVWRFESEYRQYGLRLRELANPVPDGLPKFWTGTLNLLYEFAERRRKGERELRSLEVFNAAYEVA